MSQQANFRISKIICQQNLLNINNNKNRFYSWGISNKMFKLWFMTICKNLKLFVISFKMIFKSITNKNTIDIQVLKTDPV